jgi:hypothetical protein
MEGNAMKSRIALVLAIAVALSVCAVYADSHERMVAIWKCKLNEGKTTEDVQAANAKWVKHANAAIEEDEIRSFVLTTAVGNHEIFLYVDTFPGGAEWVAMRAAMQDEEGQAIEKELNEVATCSHNSLYDSERTMAAE